MRGFPNIGRKKRIASFMSNPFSVSDIQASMLISSASPFSAPALFQPLAVAFHNIDTQPFSAYLMHYGARSVFLLYCNPQK